MTDAHCHLGRGAGRHFICDPADSAPADGDVVFRGWHPWRLDGFDAQALRAALAAGPRCGVGEIGLDRLKDRNISDRMRGVFAAQLEIAAGFGRPVVLHGAKCWGEVVRTCRPFAGRIPAFLFHGFSRSAGLIPEMEAMNGFVSVGPAVLNMHAANYRELVRALPAGMLLAESDATAENAAEAPSAAEVAAETAALRGVSAAEMTAVMEANADRFVSALL